MDIDFKAAALARGAKMLPEGMRVIAEVFCGCVDPALAWTWARDYLQISGTWMEAGAKP